MAAGLGGDSKMPMSSIGKALRFAGVAMGIGMCGGFAVGCTVECPFPNQEIERDEVSHGDLVGFSLSGPACQGVKPCCDRITGRIDCDAFDLNMCHVFLIVPVAEGSCDIAFDYADGARECGSVVFHSYGGFQCPKEYVTTDPSSGMKYLGFGFNCGSAPARDIGSTGDLGSALDARSSGPDEGVVLDMAFDGPHKG